MELFYGLLGLRCWKSKFTPGGGIELMQLLGKEQTIERVKKAIEILKGAI